MLGLLACITLMIAIVIIKTAIGIITAAKAIQLAQLSPKIAKGNRKKTKMRYTIANHRYFAVVFPKNLARRMGA